MLVTLIHLKFEIDQSVPSMHCLFSSDFESLLLDRNTCFTNKRWSYDYFTPHTSRANQLKNELDLLITEEH